MWKAWNQEYVYLRARFIFRGLRQIRENYECASKYLHYTVCSTKEVFVVLYTLYIHYERYIHGYSIGQILRNGRRVELRDGRGIVMKLL